jgi:hypothetical protein
MIIKFNRYDPINSRILDETIYTEQASYDRADLLIKVLAVGRGGVVLPNETAPRHYRAHVLDIRNKETIIIAVSGSAAPLNDSEQSPDEEHSIGQPAS